VKQLLPIVAAIQMQEVTRQHDSNMAYPSDEVTLVPDVAS
jgi:hypothetical protein